MKQSARLTPEEGTAAHMTQVQQNGLHDIETPNEGHNIINQDQRSLIFTAMKSPQLPESNQ